MGLHGRRQVGGGAHPGIAHRGDGGAGGQAGGGHGAVRDLVARYKSISEKLSPHELTAAYSGSLLGGNPAMGERIFFSNTTAQCMKCHAYNDKGGNAGPRLNGIANKLSREQILESLITPSARLAPGYGMVNLELKDGKKLFGLLEKENETIITVKIAREPAQVIQKSQVAKRTDSPSSMPDMKQILSKREIRDIVSFLATLKEDN